MALGAALLCWTPIAAAAASQARVRVLWTSAPVPNRGDVSMLAGDVIVEGRDVWIAQSTTGPEAAHDTQVIRVALSDERASAAPLASFAGGSPSLGLRRNGELVLAYAIPPGDASSLHPGALMLRRAESEGRGWSDPVTIATRSGVPRLANGRVARISRGTWIVPCVWQSRAESRAPDEIICHVSNDEGASWKEAGVLRAAGATDPAVAEAAAGQLVLIVRRATPHVSHAAADSDTTRAKNASHPSLHAQATLARSVSNDGGATWSALEPLGIPTAVAPHALRSLPGGELALAWSDPPPDTSTALPGVPMLHLALSADAGKTWRRQWPLVLWPGEVPRAPALSASGSDLVALYESRRDSVATLVCKAYSRHGLEREAHLPPPEHARGRYSLDPKTARDALRVLTRHTLLRAHSTKRLFVECYFMRSLVAAHAALEPHRDESAEPLDTREGLSRAIAYADHLAASQDAHGYWALGYGAVYIADMAATAGLFAALEPHVDAERAMRYEKAILRFLDALRQDIMLLPGGACGVGWPNSYIIKKPARAVREPYLVSTALAGIEAQAWAYHRTHQTAYRVAAEAALDFTLAQLRPDGSLPSFSKDEGELTSAAYVQEGWMAADLLLEDPKLLKRLRDKLPAHVAWLLRMQRPDGTWDHGAYGEFARTPSIIDFLIWYDQRCQPREDVRLAVRRASAVYLDPERWSDYRLFRAGNHHEVLRAISGRPLAALASEKFVP